MANFTDLQIENISLLKGDIQIKQAGFGSIHYGNRGMLGQATSFNPDANHLGLWIEGSDSGSESGGLFMNGNVICLWSPGDNDLLRVYDEGSFTYPRLLVDNSGTLIMNDSSGQPTIRLNGQTGQITIKDWTLSVPDSVFDPDFELKPLNELKAYLHDHKHLPEIPPAREIHETGVNMGQFSMLLLKKIEELSLYILRQQESIQAQSDRIAKLESAIGTLKAPGLEV